MSCNSELMGLIRQDIPHATKLSLMRNRPAQPILRILTMATRRSRPIFVLAEELVQTWIRNEAELTELETLRKRKERVHAYMRATGSRPRLALAYLDRVENAQRDQLIRLRASRRTALSLMACADGELKSLGAKQHPGRPRQSTTSCTARVSPLPETRKYA